MCVPLMAVFKNISRKPRKRCSPKSTRHTPTKVVLARHRYCALRGHKSFRRCKTRVFFLFSFCHIRVFFSVLAAYFSATSLPDVTAKYERLHRRDTRKLIFRKNRMFRDRHVRNGNVDDIYDSPFDLSVPGR